MLIDNHLNSDQTAVQSTTTWMTGWARIMTAINADPISKKFVMYDILNEPDSQGIPWVGQGGKWGMQDYYLNMMTQGYAINPAAVYFIEVRNLLHEAPTARQGLCTVVCCCHTAVHCCSFCFTVTLLVGIADGFRLHCLQGCAQGSISANWGDGFSTNRTLFPSGSAGSPVTFFTQLLTKPYA